MALLRSFQGVRPRWFQWCNHDGSKGATRRLRRPFVLVPRPSSLVLETTRRKIEDEGRGTRTKKQAASKLSCASEAFGHRIGRARTCDGLEDGAVAACYTDVVRTRQCRYRRGTGLEKRHKGRMRRHRGGGA